MRVFLDANILFSAARSDGAVRSLLQLCLEKKIQCVADPYVVAEAERNIHLKAPNSGVALARILKRLEVSADVTSFVLPEASARLLPEKDRPVLAAAIALQCDALLTGDKTHFGPIYGKTIEGVTVYSPADFYRAIHRW